MQDESGKILNDLSVEYDKDDESQAMTKTIFQMLLLEMVLFIIVKLI